MVLGPMNKFYDSFSLICTKDAEIQNKTKQIVMAVWEWLRYILLDRTWHEIIKTIPFTLKGGKILKWLWVLLLL